jgi:long-chain acyl-CoA synthetase
MDLSGYSEGAQALLGPGGSFEMAEADVGGVILPVFATAPRHLLELYQGGLAHGDGTFYVYEDERYTFNEAGDEVGRVMRALRSMGIQSGDRVGICMRNYPEWTFAFMAITSMGGVAVAMNAWWTGEEMIYGVEDSGLKTIFVDRERLELLSPYLGVFQDSCHCFLIF